MSEHEKDVNEIIPHLWLGNYKAAYDKGFLNKYNINYIITIMDDFDRKISYNNIIHFIIPLKDKDLCSRNLINIFETTANFINKVLNENSSILVHCKRGHHRSSSVIAAYLIKFLKIKYEVAIKYINFLRPCAFRRDTCMSKGLFQYYLYINNIKNCEMKCVKHSEIFNIIYI